MEIGLYRLLRSFAAGADRRVGKKSKIKSQNESNCKHIIHLHTKAGKHRRAEFGFFTQEGFGAVIGAVFNQYLYCLISGIDAPIFFYSALAIHCFLMSKVYVCVRGRKYFDNQIRRDTDSRTL